MATIRELSLSELRRNLHAHPETGWKEFRTTALIAEELEERGFVVHLGADAVNPDSRMGVPDDVPAARERAREEGAPEEYIDRMGDITGLVAEKRYGDGPVVGIEPTSTPWNAKRRATTITGPLARALRARIWARCMPVGTMAMPRLA